MPLRKRRSVKTMNKEKGTISLRVVEIEEDSSPGFYTLVKREILALNVFYTLFFLLDFSAAALIIYQLIKVTSGFLQFGLILMIIIWGIAALGTLNLIKFGVEFLVGMRLIEENEIEEEN